LLSFYSYQHISFFLYSTIITFGRKLKHLRQKNHLTQKELGIALGFPEDSADIRIAQYEADARKPRDEIHRTGDTFLLHFIFGMCIFF